MMRNLVSVRPLLLMIGLSISGITLSSVPGYASTGTDNTSGLRLAGRTIDGAIVIDGSDSNLTAWEVPAVIERSSIQYLRASELVAIGTIDLLDLTNRSLTVAGQTASLTSDTRLVDALDGTSRPLDSIDNANLGLSIGRHVAIAGYTIGPGQSIASFIVLISSEAAPGTSLVYVRGVLQEINKTSREAVIGNSKLTFVASGTSHNDELLPGNVIEVIGYQAGPYELVVTEFSNLTLPEPIATTFLTQSDPHGSGLKGIHGSGLKGIHGSGLKGIHGSGLKGIHGSGLKAAALDPSALH